MTVTLFTNEETETQSEELSMPYSLVVVGSTPNFSNLPLLAQAQVPRAL